MSPAKKRSAQPKPQLAYQTKRQLKITLLRDPTQTFRAGAEFMLDQFLRDVKRGVHADGTRIRYRQTEYAIWMKRPYSVRTGRLAGWFH